MNNLDSEIILLKNFKIMININILMLILILLIKFMMENYKMDLMVYIQNSNILEIMIN